LHQLGIAHEAHRLPVLDGAPAPEDGPQGFEAVREGGEEETRKRHEAETWRETRGWG